MGFYCLRITTNSTSTNLQPRQSTSLMPAIGLQGPRSNACEYVWEALFTTGGDDLTCAVSPGWRGERRSVSAQSNAGCHQTPRPR